jgi:hypothetical protein
LREVCEEAGHPNLAGFFLSAGEVAELAAGFGEGAIFRHTLSFELVGFFSDMKFDFLSEGIVAAGGVEPVF